VNAADGSQPANWPFTVPNASQLDFSTPIVDSAGVVYVRSRLDGKVYAIQ
jgi:hypothetical protein